MVNASTIPTLAFIDVESSGLEVWAGHRPWEVAAIIRHLDGGEAEHVWQIRPDLATADDVALAVGRYAERCVLRDGWEGALFEGGQPWRATAWAVADDIRQVLHGATLVGANVGFDREMLAALLHDHGLTPSWHYRPTCVEVLVQGAMRLPDPPGLKDAADLTGVKYDPDELHTALGDARLARSIYDAVMAGGAR